MPTTFTPNTNLALLATGEDSGTWGSLQNTQIFTPIDSVFGAVQTISLSSTDVTLSTPQTQSNFIKLTGALTANVSVVFPAIGRTFIVQNNTTGAFTVTLKIGAGASATLAQGSTLPFVLDATNVYQATPAQTSAFLDGVFRIQNTAAPTKQIAFDASGITAGTTRTLTAPNVSITLGDAAMFRGALSGLTLSNDVGTPASFLDIAAGCARDSTNVDNLILASAYTKNIATAWAVGTGNGSLDTGSVANGTYHVFAIMRTDSRVVDVLTSLSATAPTMPASYTLFRRIGSIIRAAGAVLAFVQDGDRFYWNNASLTADYSGGSRAKAALAVNVPAGIRVEGIFQITVAVGAAANVTSTMTLYDGANANIGKSATIFIQTSSSNSLAESLTQFTNTSAQIQLAYTPANGTGSITTLGWVDPRGR